MNQQNSNNNNSDLKHYCRPCPRFGNCILFAFDTDIRLGVCDLLKDRYKQINTVGETWDIQSCNNEHNLKTFITSHLN